MPSSRRWPAWRCPEHSEPLEQAAGVLSCPEGHTYRIREGVGRFVEGATYADAFGEQWKRYRLTQLDSHSGLPISRDRARRCLGDDLWASLEEMQVLECGCGAGRFTEVLLDRGATVTSVDLSTAVEANAENFPPSERHRIAQADATRLPFEPRGFELVFCLGVVQHTPDPERTIAALYEQVRPGGWLVFDHYSYRVSWFLSTAPAFRRVLRRMPAERGLRATEAIVDRLLPLHRRAARNRWVRRGVNRLSPVVSFYSTMPELTDELQREWALLDTHDSLTDFHRHFRTVGQLERTLTRLGVQDVCVVPGGNGIEARGRRPQ